MTPFLSKELEEEFAKTFNEKWGKWFENLTWKEMLEIDYALDCVPTEEWPTRNIKPTAAQEKLLNTKIKDLKRK